MECHSSYSLSSYIAVWHRDVFKANEHSGIYKNKRAQQVVLIEHPHTINEKLANLLTLLKLTRAKVTTEAEKSPEL
jgi:tRNA A37 threonylcarbamoyladenosine biosynthesis protein TsaE